MNDHFGHQNMYALYKSDNVCLAYILLTNNDKYITFIVATCRDHTTWSIDAFCCVCMWTGMTGLNRYDWFEQVWLVWTGMTGLCSI